MFTTRLSSVITGCGSNETTCSRRSTMSRIRSTNGTTIVRPGLSVRLYRPSRSTTPARACGTIRIVRARTISTNTTTTSKTINAITANLRLVHERGRAPDLGHLDLRAGLEDEVVDVRPGRPLLAADPHAAPVRVDALHDGCFRADECRRPRPDERRHVQMRAGDRPEQRKRRERGDDEDDELHERSDSDRRRDRRGDGGECDGAEKEQTRSEQLADRKYNSGDHPDHPARHVELIVGQPGRARPSAAGRP